MCRECEFAADVFRAARKNPDQTHYPTLLLMDGMARRGPLELYAGDCAPADFLEEFESERHFSVCHYYRCRRCGQVFFLGDCIRGPAKLELPDSLEDVNWDNMIWGRLGRRYE